MSEKEFNFQDPEPELETPEEIKDESEYEEVREVSLVFPENEPWPPQPDDGPGPADPPPSNPDVQAYIEEIEGLNQEEVEKEDVCMYSGKPANSPSQSFGGVRNGTRLEGFYFYTIKHQTGITLNGKHFDAGSYWFDQEAYEGISIIDLPFQ